MALEQFLTTAAAENPNRRLRMMALQDRVSMRVERADFDDLVTLVTQAPTWEKERLPGIRILLRAIGEEKPDAPEQILARWTWRLARATRKVQDRRASAEYPEAKRLLGALANSRGHRHEENAAKLVQAALELPLPVGAALLASAEGYTPRATKLIDDAREQLGTIQEVALALAENLPAPKQGGGRSRRRRRRRRKGGGAAAKAAAQAKQNEHETLTEQAGREAAPQMDRASPSSSRPGVRARSLLRQTCQLEATVSRTLARAAEPFALGDDVSCISGSRSVRAGSEGASGLRLPAEELDQLASGSKLPASASIGTTRSRRRRFFTATVKPARAARCR